MIDTPTLFEKSRKDVRGFKLPKSEIDENNIETAIPSMKAEASKDRITENNPTGSVEGDVSISKLIVESGAIFNAKSSMKEQGESGGLKKITNFSDSREKTA